MKTVLWTILLALAMIKPKQLAETWPLKEDIQIWKEDFEYGCVFTTQGFDLPGCQMRFNNLI